MPENGREKTREGRIDVREGEKLPQGSFVIVEDVRARMKDWLGGRGFTVANKSLDGYIRDIEAAVGRTFVGADDVPTMTLSEDAITTRASADIARMVNSLGGKSRVGVITLDRAYGRMLSNSGITSASLEMTRTVSGTGESTGNLDVRSGAESIETQIASIRGRFAESGITDVIIADDVFFSGNQAIVAMGLLKESGLSVVGAYAGVATTESLDRLREDAEASDVPEFKIGAAYSGEARDIIDLRDLTPAAPGGGRTLEGADNVGIPYLLPFGNPAEWASIPAEKATAFSGAVLDAAITFYKDVEVRSRKTIRLSDLDRGIYSVTDGSSTADADGEEPLVAWLERQKGTLPL